MASKLASRPNHLLNFPTGARQSSRLRTAIRGFNQRDHAAILLFLAGFLYFLAGFFFFAFLDVFCAAKAPSELTIAPAGRTTAAPNAATMAAIRSFFTGCLRCLRDPRPRSLRVVHQINQDNS